MCFLAARLFQEGLVHLLDQGASVALPQGHVPVLLVERFGPHRRHAAEVAAVDALQGRGQAEDVLFQHDLDKLHQGRDDQDEDNVL